jgi:hypothetical protein
MRKRVLCIAAVSAAFSVPAPSAVVEGQRFDDDAQIAGRSVVLNGTGIRAVAWFKGYVAGLYLPARASTAAAAVTMAGPKRLRMVMLHEVPAAEFTKAFDKGVSRNADKADLPALRERMKRFEALIVSVGKVKKGDIVDLDLEPEKGTVFLINGKSRGDPIEGSDFYAALLRAFVGERPYDDKLKAGLLGRGS